MNGPGIRRNGYPSGWRETVSVKEVKRILRRESGKQRREKKISQDFLNTLKNRLRYV